MAILCAFQGRYALSGRGHQFAPASTLVGVEVGRKVYRGVGFLAGVVVSSVAFDLYGAAFGPWEDSL